MRFLFRLWWPLYIVLAVCVLASTAVLTWGVISGNAERRAALAAPAPAAIALQDFKKSEDIGPVREVTISFQPDLENIYTLERQKKKKFGRTSSSFATALFAYGTDASEPDKPVRAALVLDGKLTVDELNTMIASFKPQRGPKYPVITVNGTVPSYDKFTSLVKEAIEKEGLQPADDIILIEPFMEGREAALAQKEYGTIAMIGVVVALLCVAYGLFRRKQSLAAA